MEIDNQVEQTPVTPNAPVAPVDTQPPVAQTEVEDTTAKPQETDVREIGLKKEAKKEDGDSQVKVSEHLNNLVAKAMTGELTDEERKGLEESGFSDHFDLIVQGHKARQEAADNEVYSVVGNKEAYKELQAWAVSTLSDAEIETFNNAVIKSNDVGIAKLAVEALQARYIKQKGREPSKVIEGGGGTDVSNTPFTSVQDYIKETMSRKYKNDPAYAAEVERKRNQSGF